MGFRKSLQNTLEKVDRYSPWPSRYSFVMSDKEKKLFDNTVKPSKAYLEFGTGGSTFRVLQKSDAKIYSIDSSHQWIRCMREYWFIRRMEKKRLSLFYVDIGPIKKWGKPSGTGSVALYPRYSETIFDLIDEAKIDTVLVDGRFRVACTLKTVLEFHSNHDLKILIHDFWNRNDYHVVLKYLDAVDKADTLGLFSIKKGIDITAVRDDYELYKYNSS